MSTDFKSYDEMPYTSYAFADSHPSRLHAVAQVFGLTAAPLENARVLELGCASGGNLTPLALYYPSIQLVGVDYSSVQIDDGIAIIEKIGLSNVQLKHMSITDITPDFGKFDYIICHGVYSWVPEDVQAAIMRVCHENLTDNGVAYISYNVYPGWKTHEIARDAMLFHTRNISDNRHEKVSHARGMIQYMHEMSTDGSMFRHIMNNESELIQNAQPYYIAHEFLETHNAPCYFSQFASRAQAHGLSYLGDTQLATMFVETLGDEHKQRLINASEGDQVMLEQYLDFLRNRSFRQTLLVKNTFAASLNRNINLEHLKKLALMLSLKRVETADPAAHQYENEHKQSITVYSATQQSALKILNSYCPNPIHYERLMQDIQHDIHQNFVEPELLSLIERLLIIGFIKPWSSVFTTPYTQINQDLPNHPQINALVAAHAIAAGHLTSHMHQNAPLNAVLTTLLPLLDGTRGIDELTQHVMMAVQQGQIQFQRHNTQESVTDAQEIEAEALFHTQRSIELLKNNGFLIQPT